MMIIKRPIFIVALCLMGASFTFAQKAERKNVREGNKLYKKEKYTESEISYRKSLEVNPRSIEGTYNLGNSLYKQGKFPEAAEQYQLIAAQEKDPVKLAQVFHNLGNISMKNKQYDKSVHAYRQSLRLNPKDDVTRYYLALAQMLLENQQTTSPWSDTIPMVHQMTLLVAMENSTLILDLTTLAIPLLCSRMERFSWLIPPAIGAVKNHGTCPSF